MGPRRRPPTVINAVFGSKSYIQKILGTFGRPLASEGQNDV